MNQTHQVIGTCAAHISWNLRSRDSEVEFRFTFIHKTGQIFYLLKYLEISPFSRDTKTTRFSGNNYILIK